MISQLSPELPNELYAALVRRRAQERQVRRLLRKQKADRLASRRPAEPGPVTLRPRPV